MESLKKLLRQPFILGLTFAIGAYCGSYIKTALYPDIDDITLTPKDIQTIGLKYHIKIVDYNPENNLFGLTNNLTKEMTLGSTNINLQTQTLIHESFHARYPTLSEFQVTALTNKYVKDIDIWLEASKLIKEIRARTPDEIIHKNDVRYQVKSLETLTDNR